MSTKYIASNWRLPNQENSSKSDNYGLTFDGSEYIVCNEKFNFVQQTGIFSISCWIKFDNYNANSLQTILQTNGNGSSQHGFWLAYDNRTGIETNTIFFSLYRGAGGGAQDRIEKTSAIGDNNFHHIVIVSDGTDMNLFIDNSNVATFNNITISPSGVAYNNLEIGRYSSTNPFAIDGSISQVSIFDYTLSSTQISTLYGSSSLGSTSPMALKPQPVAFYPLGDNSASNPLTQPNEAVEDASVFEFGTSDYIEANRLNIINSISGSCWFKTSENSGRGVLIAEDDLATNRNWTFRRKNTNIECQFRFSSTTTTIETTGINISDNNWHSAVFVWDGTTNTDSFKIFIDGILRAKGTPSETTLETDNASLRISDSSTSYDFIGQLSNAQVWNVGLELPCSKYFHFLQKI